MFEGCFADQTYPLGHGNKLILVEGSSRHKIFKRHYTQECFPNPMLLSHGLNVMVWRMDT